MPLIEADCLVEYSDGSMNYERFYDLMFIDTPEDEQRAEFAKAAMQGYISSGSNYKMAELINLSILCADELIAELKKQKPCH